MPGGVTQAGATVAGTTPGGATAAGATRLGPTAGTTGATVPGRTSGVTGNTSAVRRWASAVRHEHESRAAHRDGRLAADAVLQHRLPLLLPSRSRRPHGHDARDRDGGLRADLRVGLGEPVSHRDLACG